MMTFNSPEFAIRYLKREGILLKRRDPADMPQTDPKPILTFAHGVYTKPQNAAVTYLDKLGTYRLMMEDYFAKKPKAAVRADPDDGPDAPW